MADPRKRVRLGKTQLNLTQLSLGTAPIGGLYTAVTDEDARATVEAAWELGLRLFDTAPYYGYGLAETRLGAALAEKPRHDFVLSTKVGRLIRPLPPERFDESGSSFKGTPPLEPVFDFSHDGVMRSVEESLARLGLDRVDMLLIHDPDAHFHEAMTAAYPALDRLRSEGVIGAIGAGMNQAEMLVEIARAGDFDLFLVAGRYTLLDQVALAELLPLCTQKSIGVIIGGVYNSGILVRPEPGATFNYAPADAAWLERAGRLKAVCDRYEVPLAAAALQFPLAHPAVTSVLMGARSVAEVAENVRLFGLAIPAALWQELLAEGLLPEEAPLPA